MATKTFILDTNVLIHDPKAFLSFEDNVVVIPMAVIEELDTLKKFTDERARSARAVSRNLNRLAGTGKFSEGINLENGGRLLIGLEKRLDLPYDFSNSKKDNLILSDALTRKKRGENVILITKDINLRIKSEVMGVTAMDYEKEKVKYESLYQGWKEITISGELIDKFYKNRSLETNVELQANEFVLMKDSSNPSKSAIGKFDKKSNMIMGLSYKEGMVWGLKPLNTEQKFAFELLLSDNIHLVTLIGVPGAGKTLLSLAAALHKTIDKKLYRRLLITKPVTPVGKDIGFLPGSKEEKVSQWMGSIYDNLEFLVDKNNPDDSTEEKVNYFFDSGKIEMEALAFLRGRSIPKQFIIIDDAQNLTPHEIKTIISRAGEGSKIVLTGDPYQIDNPYLDADSNGLTYLVERFKNQEIYGHLNFKKTERSMLAALAGELL
ncbi:MAG: PhoH-like protein [Elusimicrobia bacterium ADurb.Bin231]|nr:MAG: PhoH-like protein [Elusimicrobia bacterium ADurb.Bin231]